MNIKELEIIKLKPYENNPRINNDAVEYVANSIKEFGFKVPIVIDKDYNIVTGHTRYEASKLLKLEKVPCIMANDLTEEQVRKFRIVDNKVSEYSFWDFEKLDEELEGILDIDMEDYGFLNFDDNFEFIDRMLESGIGGGAQEKELFKLSIDFPADEKELIENNIEIMTKKEIIIKVVERIEENA